MTTLPKIRNKISISAGEKNQSLKDILAPMGPGIEVLSVEAVTTPLYNTKATIRIDNAKAVSLEDHATVIDKSNTRVILYNRIDIATVLPASISASFEDLAAVIKELNTVHSCDFTEDDIELGDCGIRAKATSLGYYNSGESTPAQGTPRFKIRVGIRPFADLSQTIREMQKDTYAVRAEVFVNGVKYSTQPFTHHPNETVTSALEIAQSIVNLINTNFTDIKAKIVIQTPWLMYDEGGSSNSVYTNETAVIEIENVSGNNVDLGIRYSFYVTPEGVSGGTWVDSQISFALPPTRLKPAGTFGEGCSCGCVGKDTVLLDLSPAKVKFIEAALKDVVVNFSDFHQGYFDNVNHAEIRWPYLGYINLLWIFWYNHPDAVNPLNDNSKDLGFLINKMNTAYDITLVDNATSKLSLAAASNKTPLDKVIFAQARVVDQWYKYSDIILNVGDNEYRHNVSELIELYYGIESTKSFISFDIGITALIMLHPEIKDVLNINRMNLADDFNHMYWMFENLTDTRLNFSLQLDNDGSKDLFPPFILEPKGTLSEAYDLEHPVVQSELTNTLYDLINTTGALKTITWRGVTSPFKQSGSFDWFTGWDDKASWDRIIICRNNPLLDETEGNEKTFFLITPYRETMIFNKGLENECVITLDPSPVTPVLYSIPT